MRAFRIYLVCSMVDVLRCFTLWGMTVIPSLKPSNFSSTMGFSGYKDWYTTNSMYNKYSRFALYVSWTWVTSAFNQVFDLVVLNNSSGAFCFNPLLSSSKVNKFITKKKLVIWIINSNLYWSNLVNKDYILSCCLHLLKCKVQWSEQNDP